MVGTAQAQQYYGMDQRYNSYEPEYGTDYGMNSYDKKPYGKDHSYDKSKDSSVTVKKIKCNNINVNLNGDIDIGASQALGALATEAQASDEGEIAASGSDAGRPSGSDTDFKVVCIYNNIPPEPVKDPILTVKKEMFICKTPHLTGDDVIDCINDSTKTIPGPDSTEWIPWDDCTVTDFCQVFDEVDFRMQIEQNPGPFEFPGNSDGRSVIVESGTFQVTEEVSPDHHQCENTDYEDGSPQIVHDNQLSGYAEAAFCFTLEGDCSGTIQSGEEKACTVKNYFFIGRFIPPTGNDVNGETTGITTQSNNAITTQSNNAITTQSNNAITTQSNNAITNTTITTQSSNVGAALQSNDVGSTTTQSSNVASTTTQSSNVAGIPNTFSSSFSLPSSQLANIFP